MTFLIPKSGEKEGIRLMPRIFFKKKILDTSAIPQADTHSEEEKREANKITLVVCGVDKFEETEVQCFEECIPTLESRDLVWINVDGHPSHVLLKKMQDHFKLHPLFFDVICSEQRPKVEPYDSVLYIVLRSLYYDHERVMI